MPSLKAKIMTNMAALPLEIYGFVNKLHQPKLVIKGKSI